MISGSGIIYSENFMIYPMAINWLIAPEHMFPNTLTAIAYTIFIITWILAEAYNRYVSSKNASGERKDHGSFYLINVLTFVAIVGAVMLRISNVWVYIGDMQVIGLALGFFGIILREYSIAVLGRSFTVKVEVDKKRELTKSGPYRYIRHPSYTGTLLTMVGFGLALGTWAGTLLLIVLKLVAYAYRINVEEKALTETYGEEYLKYKKKTWKLLPGY